MIDHGNRLSMPETKTGGDSDAWLMSYLDVLTLLITLFVLLVSMLGQDTCTSALDPTADPSQATQQTASAGSASSGIQPRHQGLQPESAGLQPQDAGLMTKDLAGQSSFRGLEGVEGVSIAEGQEGITLRIDDNLLFASGEAQLTSQGRAVIESLVPTLESFGGQISVEGHTDDIPISTARFPSNWELSTSRAIAVVRHLIQSGVSEGRLRAIGYADTQPIASNDTAEGRAVNRRVELLLKQQL